MGSSVASLTCLRQTDQAPHHLTKPPLMRLLCICLFVLCSALGNSQDARKVSCRLLCLEGAAAPPLLLNLSAKGTKIPCIIPPNTFSAPVICHAKGDAITFLTASDLKPAALATIPANVKTAIVVFAPAANANDSPPWRTFVIEDFPANFPDSGALVANFCSQDVRFTIDDNPVTLHTGMAHTFDRPKNLDAFNMGPLLAEFHQDDSWRTVNENLLRFAPGMRFLIYAYFDDASNRARIATCQDIPVTKPAPKK